MSDDSSDVGMIDATKSIVPPAAWAFSASAAPVLAVSGVMSSPLPGLSRLPTTRPMPSATVDMPMKYARARPPTLPTLAAARTEPMPSTMVQKITGLIIILIRSTNIVPSTPSDLPASGASQPTSTPATTATTTPT